MLVDGVWGFAAASDLTTQAAVDAAEQAIALARVSAPLATERVELADEPVHADVEWVSAYDIDPFDVPSADRAELHGHLVEPADVRRRGPCRRGGHGGQGAEVLRRPGRHLDPAAAHPPQPGRDGGRRQQRGRRDHAVARTRHGPRLGVPGRHAGAGCLALGRGARHAAGPRGREAQGPHGRGRNVRPGDRPEQPLADHPRVDRPRHRAGPGAGLRGGVRRHLVRDDRPARLAAVRQRDHARHRRPHRRHALATVGYDDEGVQTQSWDIVRDGILVGYQLDRGMARQNADRTGSPAPTAARSPTRPATSPSSGWPMSASSPRPTGPRPRS